MVHDSRSLCKVGQHHHADFPCVCHLRLPTRPAPSSSQRRPPLLPQGCGSRADFYRRRRRPHTHLLPALRAVQDDTQHADLIEGIGETICTLYNSLLASYTLISTVTDTTTLLPHAGLPIFPLGGLVAFPHADVPLNIFEARCAIAILLLFLRTLAPYHSLWPARYRVLFSTLLSGEEGCAPVMTDPTLAASSGNTWH